MQYVDLTRKLQFLWTRTGTGHMPCGANPKTRLRQTATSLQLIASDDTLRMNRRIVNYWKQLS